jgi:hypothetical protein
MDQLGMSSGWEEHLIEVILPAWQDYLSAEHKLSTAAKIGDEVNRRKQSYAALRCGAAAVLFLHHFNEVVLRVRPAFLPQDVHTTIDLQEWLTGYCTYLRTDRIAADVLLLGELVVAVGRRQLPSGEGKVDSIDQVVVQWRGGSRALSAVLQNVVDAWRRAAGLRMPEIGLP